MPGTLVWKFSSTGTRPLRSSTATPASFRPRSVRVRPAADRHQHRSPVNCTSPFLPVALTTTWPPFVSAPVTLRFQVEFQPLLAQRSVQLLGDLAVGQRQDARQKLDAP